MPYNTTHTDIRNSYLFDVCVCVFVWCVISTQDELDENSKCVYEKLIFDDDEEEVKTKKNQTHTQKKHTYV